MLSLPWSVVTALRLEPVGPIKADVLGLRYVDEWHNEFSEAIFAMSGEDDGACFHIAEPRRLAQLREALGSLVHDPRLNQVPFNPERHPWYIALTHVHLALTEEVGNG